MDVSITLTILHGPYTSHNGSDTILAVKFLKLFLVYGDTIVSGWYS